MASTKDVSPEVTKIKKSKKDKSEKKDTSSKKRKTTEAVLDAPLDDVEFKKSKASDATAAPEVDAPPSGGAQSTAPAEPLANGLDSFPLSAPIKSLLRSRGIESLFDIQAACLQPVLDGKDLVGRARTGCGKTLAFVLPIVERLAARGRGGRGRAPSVIVLAPTRELAKQVGADFEAYGAALGLECVCVYGGAQMGPQTAALRRGVDVVVGTPGRVKDHIERGTLSCAGLAFRVLDECDEMLNMGFVDDVEKILNQSGANTATVQTLLFSATLPAWVKQITAKFLKPDHATVDLVGDSRMKASTSVRHLLLPCHWSQRGTVVQDLVRCYGALGRSIVFTETKNDANELASALSESVGARALHGDIPQSQREVTLAGFRDGKFSVLVATDVAARGLDIKDVELVVQSEPPKEPETYIHRSGRTGRARATGTCITLVDRRKEGLVPLIERRAGMKFERIGAPQPADMARVAGERAVEALADMDPAVVAAFRPAAQALLDAAAGSAVDALAGALAKITGCADMKPRSLLTAHEGFVTLRLSCAFDVERAGQVFGVLRKVLSEEQVNEVKGMTLTADGKGAVFDVPHALADAFRAALPEPEDGTAGAGKFGCMIQTPSALPEVAARKEAPGFGAGGYGGGGYGGGRGGGYGGGGYGGGRGGGYGGNRGGAGRGGAGFGGAGRGGAGHGGFRKSYSTGNLQNSRGR